MANHKERVVELFFIPSPLMGHVGQLVQLANLMATRFHHLTINVLVMHLPNDPIGTNYTHSLIASSSEPDNDHNQIKFIQFPSMDLDSFPEYPNAGVLADAVIERHKPIVRELIASCFSRSDRLSALVVDMFCTSMIDVGKEFGVPSYIFFPPSAAVLGIMFYFQTLEDEQGQEISELANAETPLIIPSYAKPVPPTVLPYVFLDKDSWSKRFGRYARKYREAKGIIINTFLELEPHALHSYDDKTPPVYTVGPMLKPEKPIPNNELLQWLDGQPNSSVLLLCFGSRGWFELQDQVKEIATAIERSGYRFIWSLRRPPSENQKGFPGEHTDYNEVLPDGFLDRTSGKGKVVGWLPQTAVLAHVAVGGFVSHCGWNSILESLWYGVPIATWPIYNEQSLNAHQLVKEVGLAVEISLDYNQFNKNQRLVSAEEIEKGIREVMDSRSEVRAKVAEMKTKSRMAVEEGGSSFASLRQLVDDFM
ncbi:anthocyanidin 3-O-glucosyltransferase 2-like [Cynara cardunculus var. scolymus]|uniref:anthocyanidin 3-O-glucosyltransferase 2-like n=1 Tax=Cynara cardunculus var. scolymus TaxID=59895 RepID=UPI000D62F5A0|nr:anthocyanidin 3-O-glucosyltransferase 2-like [Cynara cardunculus var. scolymus]